ncbi:MAG: HAD hydrolase family protein, partial [Clostridia bacterium]|nr:HAD hydrolase family protein [Clostridia bacterium]
MNVIIIVRYGESGEYMMYILFSDFDGTLRQNGVVDKKVSDAIERFRNMGNLFAVVTGRSFESGYKMFKETGDFSFDYVLNSNGTFACDCDGNPVFSKFVKANIPYGKSTFLKTFIERSMDLTNNRVVVDFEKERLFFHPDFLNGEDFYSPISDIDKIMNFSSIHLLCENADDASKVCEILNEEFGNYIFPAQNGRSIDVAGIGLNKESGVQSLIDTLGISKDFVWTVGDNYNDFDMIKTFHGCAIKSGVEKIKDVAEYVCDDVGDAINI